MNTKELAKAAFLAALKSARRCKDGTINGNDQHRALMAARKVLTDDECCEVMESTK